jgi:hypothetical protein
MCRDSFTHHRHDAGLCASINYQRTQLGGYRRNSIDKQSRKVSFPRIVEAGGATKKQNHSTRRCDLKRV